MSESAWSGYPPIEQRDAEIKRLHEELLSRHAKIRLQAEEIERLKKRIRDLETERRHLRVALKEG